LNDKSRRGEIRGGFFVLRHRGGSGELRKPARAKRYPVSIAYASGERRLA
jgi:hypothetical protein